MKPWKSYEGFEEKLPNHVFIQRVANAAGVSNQSVHRVAKKRLEKEGKRDRKRLEGCPYTFVSLDLWDTYMQIGSISRMPSKPKGWVTAKSLLEEGFSKRKLYQLVKDGQIRAVYVGNTLYLEPESAQAYVRSRQDLRPPPGWVSVSELRTRAKRSKQDLFTYLKRHHIETKQFLHPKRDQLVQYLRQEDAERYLEHMVKGVKECEEEVLQTVETTANTFVHLDYGEEASQPISELLSLTKSTMCGRSHLPFMLPRYPDPQGESGSLSWAAQGCEPYEAASW